jgi:hypothetical protein
MPSLPASNPYRRHVTVWVAGHPGNSQTPRYYEEEGVWIEGYYRPYEGLQPESTRTCRAGVKLCLRHCDRCVPHIPSI